MNSVDSSPPRRGFRLRFSLLALLVFMTAACLVLGWAVRPRQCMVEAQYLVSTRPAVLLGVEPRFDADEYKLYRESQLQLIQSPFLIQAAIRDPAIATLPRITNSSDPVQAILDRLEVRYREDSELLSIRMRGPEHMAEDLRQLVDAIGKVYLDEAANEHDQRHRFRHDALRRAYEETKRELALKRESLRALKTELGVEDSYAGGRFGIDEMQSEIDELDELLPELRRQLKVMEINSMAPARIRQVQSASVIFE